MTERPTPELRLVRLEDRDRRSRRSSLVIGGLAVFCFATAIVLFVLAPPREASGAARIPIAWTVTEQVDRWEALARRPDGVFLMPSLSRDSAGTQQLVPSAPGSHELAWLLISEDWRAGAWMVWVRGCRGATCSPWSNAVVVLAGVPDTLWHLERPASGGWLPPQDGTTWKRSAHARVAWALQYGDSMAPAAIVHQEVVQLRERDGICRARFLDAQGRPYYALRGGRVPCP